MQNLSEGLHVRSILRSRGEFLDGCICAYLDDGDKVSSRVFEFRRIDVEMVQLIPLCLVVNQLRSLSNSIKSPEVGGRILSGIWRRRQLHIKRGRWKSDCGTIHVLAGGR